MRIAVQHGYVAASVSYRLTSLPDESSRGITDKRYQTGASEFDPVRDILCAISFLSLHSDEYRIDRNRIALLGSSSGAHLAMMAGFGANDPQLLKQLGISTYEPRIAAIVNWMGPSRLIENYETNRNQHVARLETALTGCSPVEARSNQECMQKFHLLSPYYYLEATDPPFLTLHGKADNSIPVQQAKALDERANEAGSKHVTILLDDVAHKMRHVDGQSSASLALEISFSFLDRILGNGEKTESEEKNCHQHNLFSHSQKRTCTDARTGLKIGIEVLTGLEK